MKTHRELQQLGLDIYTMSRFTGTTSYYRISLSCNGFLSLSHTHRARARERVIEFEGRPLQRITNTSCECECSGTLWGVLLRFPWPE